MNVISESQSGETCCQNCIKEVEDLLHKCLDPYTPPIIQDTNQSFRYIAEALCARFSHPASKGQEGLVELDKIELFELWAWICDDFPKINPLSHKINKFINEIFAKFGTKASVPSEDTIGQALWDYDNDPQDTWEDASSSSKEPYQKRAKIICTLILGEQAK